MATDEFIRSNEFDELMGRLLEYFKDIDFSDDSEISLIHHLTIVGGKQDPSITTRRMAIEIEITKEFKNE